MKYKRSEIRANRQKWAEGLMEPERQKAIGMLEDKFGARCCLGHGCSILGIQRYGSEPYRGIAFGSSVETTIAPEEFVLMVGLWGAWGQTRFGNISEFVTPEGLAAKSLAGVNDQTSATPQEIGAYLLLVIEGGASTPFQPLSNYEE